jgi:hypothetical protein
MRYKKGNQYSRTDDDPNSRNNRPTNPSRKITGRNTAARVIEWTEPQKNISLEPLIAASIGDMPSNFINVLCDDNSIIYYEPRHNTMANKVTLMENPNSHMIKNVAISETGMSIKA